MSCDTNTTIISAPAFKKRFDILRQPCNAEQPSVAFQQNTFCIYQTTFLQNVLCAKPVVFLHPKILNQKYGTKKHNSSIITAKEKRWPTNGCHY
jgi:hypothetical protein